MRSSGFKLFVPMLVPPFLLGGCVFSNDSDLQSWMAEQKATVRPSVVSIPEPKKFVPVAYEANLQLDPFSNQRLTQALKQAGKNNASNAALVAPELSRRKQALEAYPLDTMSMTGSINKSGQMVALIKVEKLVYQVKVGDYLGQNFGKITKISETGLQLREIVQDAGGDWTERAAQLELQERSK
jgi:type IV pilus assembly protein PilP